MDSQHKTGYFSIFTQRRSFGCFPAKKRQDYPTREIPQSNARLASVGKLLCGGKSPIRIPFDRSS